MLFDFEVDFLVFRAWIGIWVAIIGAVVVAFDGSSVARYFTRFLQEIFSALISVIFISDAISDILEVALHEPIS